MVKKVYKNDAEECAAKIEALLKEYNCCVIDCDGYKGCVVQDLDTLSECDIN